MEEMTTTTAAPEASAPSGDSGAALQQEMTGDFFFSDGSNTVVDANGLTQYNDKNEPFRSMDEFSAFRQQRKPQQTQTAKPGNMAPSAQPKQQPAPATDRFSSIFEKNGQFDFDTIGDYSSRFSEIRYTPQNAPQQVSQEQPKPAPVDPIAKIKTDVEEYAKELNSARLAPLEKAWAALLQRYGGQANVPQEVYEAINAEYIAEKDRIREMVDAKKDELRDNHLREQLSQRDVESLRIKSDQNCAAVAKELFPNVPQQDQLAVMSELIFGYQTTGADGKPKFVPGYGSEIVHHLFDVANKGKTFKTAQEWTDAYNRFWIDYASSPANVKHLAKMSYALYKEKNEPKRRDAYRLQWEKEQQDKLRSLNNSPHASRGGNVMTAEGSPLDSYFAPVKANM